MFLASVCVWRIKIEVNSTKNPKPDTLYFI